MFPVALSLARRTTAGLLSRRTAIAAVALPRVAVPKRTLATATDEGAVQRPAVEGSPVVAASAEQAAVQEHQIAPENPMSHRKKPHRQRFADPERQKAMDQARKYRTMVRQLTRSTRLGRNRQALYREAIGEPVNRPLESLPNETKQFVQARAMLWRPSQQQLLQHLKATGAEDPEISDDPDVESWILGQLPNEEYDGALTQSELESEIDSILWPIWQGLSEADRISALLQVRFDCIRRLGWRTCYTSGYPIPSPDIVRQRISSMEQMTVQVDTLLEEHEKNKEAFIEQSKSLDEAKLAAIEKEESEYVESLQKRKDILREQIEYLENLEVTDKTDMLPTLEASVESNNQVALSEFLNKGTKLDEAEENEAFYDWLAMSPTQRNEEFRAAWHNRDRSLVYVDNGQTTKVFDLPMPRWYSQPERAGHLEFLPDMRIRMVKNYTPRGQPYDAWKATFRTTVDVDKHKLRTYLLQVYGLRTTFIRSMIYRPHLIRDNLTGRITRTGGKRSFKKFEVGLLEPFIWPEVLPSFAKGIAVDDIDYERSKMVIRADPFRRHSRWRGWKAPKTVDAYDSTGATVASIPATLMTRHQGIPSANVKHILTAIHARKLQDEGTVAKRAREMLNESKEGQSSQ